MGQTSSLTSGEALKNLRAMTQLSLRDFASMVGSTFASLQTAETNKRKLSPKLARKISAFTGCDPDSLVRGELLERTGAPFTDESFQRWSSAYLTPDEIDNVLSITTRAIETILGVSAIDPSGEVHPHRFRQITTKVSMVIDDLLKEYSLVDSFNTRLAEAVIPGEWESITLGQCRLKFKHTCEWRHWDSPDHSDDYKLQIRQTDYPLWHPPYSSWLDKVSAPLEAVFKKFKVRLELKAPWIQGRSEISRIEWQFQRANAEKPVRLYFDREERKVHPL
jgi:transcriptional regulator with XRE-family HTH domain